jgi:assimilatory nitrate reductase catalytic subunit
MKECSREQPCDISGIEDYRMIDECGGVQWPWSADDSRLSAQEPAVQRRLFADGRYFHADGRAKFIFELPRPMAEPVDSEYPFLLLTGRGTSSQWHTNTRTGKSDVLRKLYPAAIYIEINPLDAERLGIGPNSLVTIASRRGKITATACMTTTLQPGQIFMPMHYARVNQLTYPSFDPYSRQPSYKACAVAVAPCGFREMQERQSLPGMATSTR